MRKYNRNLINNILIMGPERAPSRSEETADFCKEMENNHDLDTLNAEEALWCEAELKKFMSELDAKGLTPADEPAPDFNEDRYETIPEVGKELINSKIPHKEIPIIPEDDMYKNPEDLGSATTLSHESHDPVSPKDK